jgi:hypothetical protein
MTQDEWISDFGQQLGMPELALDGDGYAAFEAPGDLLVELQAAPDTGELAVRVVLAGTVPFDEEARTKPNSALAVADELLALVRQIAAASMSTATDGTGHLQRDPPALLIVRG